MTRGVAKSPVGAVIRGDTETSRGVRVEIFGAGDQALAKVAEVGGTGGTDRHTDMGRVIGKGPIRAVGHTNLSGIIGVGLLSWWAVSDAKFGEIVSEVACRAVEGGLTDPGDGSTIS